MSVRYPPKVQEYARRLHGEGLTLKEVRAHLAARGYHPGREAVRIWIDPEYRQTRMEKQRENQRRQLRRRGVPPAKGKERLGEYRFKRIEKLREEGMPFKWIALILRLDHDVDLSPDQVRYMLNGTTSRRSAEALLSGYVVGRGRPPKARTTA